MKTIEIKTSKGRMREWEARYSMKGQGDVRVLSIEARSVIDVVVAKTEEAGYLGLQINYYIASPNFGVAIPCISTLQDTFWIDEQLRGNGMPAPDAITVAQVLRDLGDF